MREGPVDGDVNSREEQCRLQREARALARLDHPNIIAVFDVGELHGRLCIAMELVDGGTLRTWWGQRRARGRCCWRDVLAIMMPVARGLAAAHERGFVHRDFKPENVMVDGVGHPRIVDFGLVRELHPCCPKEDERMPFQPADYSAVTNPVSAHAETVQKTARGITMGTPGYMAPEQHLSSLCDGLSDQFAFCVTVFEMLHGYRPMATTGFEDDTYESRLDTRVPEWLNDLLRKGLRVVPSERHTTMDELIAAIESHQRARMNSVRRRWATVSGTACIAAISSLLALQPQTANLCPRSANSWAGIWNDAIKSRLEFLQAKNDFDSDHEAWPRIQRAIDEHIAEWTRVRQDACVATKIEHRASDEHFDASMHCLDLDLARYAALIDELPAKGPQHLQGLVVALHSLPPAEDCKQANVAIRRKPWPTEPMCLVEAKRLRGAIEGLRVLAQSGGWSRALEQGARLLEAGESLGFGPVVAEIHWWLGEIHRRAEHGQSAAHHHRRALVHAQASGERLVAAKSAITLVYDQAALLQDVDAAVESLEDARAGMSSVADNPGVRGPFFLNNRAIVHAGMGQLSAAKNDLKEALVSMQDAYDNTHPDVAGVATNLAVLSALTQDYASAVEHQELAVDILQNVTMSADPRLALAHHNLGSLMFMSDRPREALGHLEHAEKVCLAGDRHKLGSCDEYVQAVGEAHLVLGAFETAAEKFEHLRAKQINRIVRREAPHIRAEILLAEAEFGRGKLDAAHASAHVAVTSYLHGDSGSPTLRTRANLVLGRIEIAQGDRESGLELLSRAWREIDKAPHDAGDMWNVTAHVQLTLGDAALVQGDVQEALTLHEAALASISQGVNVPGPRAMPFMLAYAESLLTSGFIDMAESSMRRIGQIQLSHGVWGSRSLLERAVRVSEQLALTGRYANSQMANDNAVELGVYYQG